MPPYSDNLYSGEDNVSDGEESLVNELSPSDGYFRRNEMPTDQLVPDPTVDYGAPEAKTLIDPPNSLPNSGSSSRVPRHHPRSPQLSSSPPYVPPSSMSAVPQVSSHRRVGSFSEQDPLISHAPPAYSESPPPSANSSQPFRPSYSTFPEQQLERGLPISRREPESMGGPVGGPPSESTPLIPGGGFSPRRRKVKALLFALVILAVIGSTVAIVFGCADSDSRGKPIDPNAEYCPAATTRNDQTVYQFSGGKELNIIHKIKEQRDAKAYPTVTSEGEIRLRRAPVNSTHGKNPYITVDMGKSTKMATVLNWSEDTQTLVLTTPRFAERYTTRSQCLYVIITAWFPENVEITNLLFESPTLNLALSDIKVNVTNQAKFTTGSGEVWLTAEDDVVDKTTSLSTHPALCSKPAVMHAAGVTGVETQFASRQTVVETVSGAITGTYPLLDSLLISSESGTIKVAVSPQPASKAAPMPAYLEVQTATGSIRVDLPISGSSRQTIPSRSIPLRDYITRIHSTSGDISGTYYLGSESNFKTTAGTVNIITLPVLSVDESTSKVPPNVFETHTVSGTTKISVLEPLLFSTSPSSEKSSDPLSIGDNDPYNIIASPPLENKIITSKLRSLRSAHSSNTGTITASYPDAWQGSVHVKTVSGDIEVKGEGFRTVKDRSGVAFREVEKRRGVDAKGEGSAVDISNISGRVKFVVKH